MSVTLAGRTVIALVHHPVYDRERKLITTAITNLDIHDLARSSRTYGLRAYHLVTPIEAQQALARRILGHWRGDDPDATPKNDFRRQALAPVEIHGSIEESRAAVLAAFGREPLVVATSARPHPLRTSYRALTRDSALAAPPGEAGRPMLLLFGTGWGLADEVVDRVDRVLAPILGGTDYNHLSVRSAAAIVLDRLFGNRDTDGTDDDEVNREEQAP